MKPFFSATATDLKSCIFVNQTHQLFTHFTDTRVSFDGKVPDFRYSFIFILLSYYSLLE